RPENNVRDSNSQPFKPTCAEEAVGTTIELRDGPWRREQIGKNAKQRKFRRTRKTARRTNYFLRFWPRSCEILDQAQASTPATMEVRAATEAVADVDRLHEVNLSHHTVQ
ncbi:unnamed protein product, partial [Ectocarpus sp. 8 AP-2014]